MRYKCLLICVRYVEEPLWACAVMPRSHRLSVLLRGLWLVDCAVFEGSHFRQVVSHSCTHLLCFSERMFHSAQRPAAGEWRGV